jgi:hypothetical protein
MVWRVIGLFAVAGLLIAQQAKIPPATFHGTVHGVSKKQVTIENEAGNLLDFEINRKTQVMRGKKQISSSDLENGDSVTIEAREEMGRFLVAVSITAEPKKD